MSLLATSWWARMKEAHMRLRILAVIIVAAAAAVVTTVAMGGSPTPVASSNTNANSDYVPDQDALPDSCIVAATGTMCSPGHMVFPLIDGHVWYTAGPLSGLDIVIKHNGNGTYMVTWSTTNPQMTIVGATDPHWMVNGQTEDVIHQSPYTTQSGQTAFALHIDAPGLSIWDRVKPAATS